MMYSIKYHEEGGMSEVQHFPPGVAPDIIEWFAAFKLVHAREPNHLELLDYLTRRAQ